MQNTDTVEVTQIDVKGIGKGKKIFLFYPPGKAYQRGEDRSQGNIDQSSATAMRAPNDMAYGLSALKTRGHTARFRDYQSENASMQELIEDFKSFDPDVVAISITNSTIFDDLEILAELRKIKPFVTVLKGALFFNPDDELLNQLDLETTDYLVGGEFEFVIGDLIDRHYNSPESVGELRGILYKQNGQWQKTDFTSWEEDVDQIPFPDRGSINNTLYVRPDTGEPQATIATSRGCPSSCTYCLTPIISGKKVRYRNPENILEEMRDAFNNHGIRNFFFKSDTFTINHAWVKELCDLIIASELHGKIEWVANSRVRPLKKETLVLMREAGCWLIAFGFESGNQETLKKIKKGATVEENRIAAQYAKEAGLKVFGFFMIGLPWENYEHLEDTKALIFDMDCDFIELHIAVPYYGTPLYKDADKENLIVKSVLGTDYFNESTTGTKYIPIDEIVKYQRKLVLNYHLRPTYVYRKLADAITEPKVLLNYYRFGMRLLKNNLPSLSKA